MVNRATGLTYPTAVFGIAKYRSDKGISFVVADSDLLGECLSPLGIIGDKLDLIFES